jgi:hypothetical protein
VGRQLAGLGQLPILRTVVHHGFRVEQPPDGRWRTWRPDGTEILLAEPLLAMH